MWKFQSSLAACGVVFHKLIDAIPLGKRPNRTSSNHGSISNSGFPIATPQKYTLLRNLVQDCMRYTPLRTAETSFVGIRVLVKPCLHVLPKFSESPIFPGVIALCAPYAIPRTQARRDHHNCPVVRQLLTVGRFNALRPADDLAVLSKREANLRDPIYGQGGGGAYGGR